MWLLLPVNPCTCALVAIVVLAGCRLALSLSILVALNGVAVTHIVPRVAIDITSSVSHTLRAGKLDTPREGEYAISQLGQDIRTNDADNDDGEDDVTLTRRHTRRDGTRDCVRLLGFADPSVPIASINAEDKIASDARKERIREENVRARAATTRAFRPVCDNPRARARM